MERRTKIVATLGPGTSKEETIGNLVHFGVDVTRLNFSHGEHETHLKNARLVREAAEKSGRNVAVMQDIQGPKIRIGEVVGETELVEGNRVTVAPGDFLGDASRLSTPYKQLVQDVEPGHRILLDDGLLEIRVEEVEDSEIECVVVTGGPISSHKGMNFPDSSLSISGLTPKDLEDLRFGVEELRPDWIAASFVRSGDEVEEIKERISEFGGSGIPLISKVEKHEAIDDIENILKASDGIMVARGDLAVELSAERGPGEREGDGPDLPRGRGGHKLRAGNRLLHRLGSGRPLRCTNARRLRARRGFRAGGDHHLHPEWTVVLEGGALSATKQDPSRKPRGVHREDARDGLGRQRRPR